MDNKSAVLKPAVLDAAAIAALRDADEKIYVLHGVKVMLDQDLAQLYGVETRALLQSMRRNIERFPADFAFFRTNQDLAGLRSQFVISNDEKKGIGRCALRHDGLYRAGHRHALQRTQKRSGDCGQYRNHADLRQAEGHGL